METRYVKDGNRFTIAPPAVTIEDTLEKGVYKVDVIQGICSLVKIKEEFELPNKIYSLNGENEKYEYILKRINGSKTNIGFTFNGEKGSGKTLLVKRLCNKLGLPAVIFENKGKAENTLILDYLSKMNSEFVCVLDEFEKNYDRESQIAFLSFMDGLYNGKRKIFFITSNQKAYDDNLVGRLGRILYKIEFGKITSKSVISSFFREENPELSKDQLNELVTYLVHKKNLTIDTFNQVSKEVKIMGFEEFSKIGMNILNLESIHYYFKYIKYSPAPEQFDAGSAGNLSFEKWVSVMEATMNIWFSLEKELTKAEESNNIAEIEKLNLYSDVYDRVSYDYEHSTIPLEDLKVGDPWMYDSIITEIRVGKRGTYVYSEDRDGDECYCLVTTCKENKFAF